MFSYSFQPNGKWFVFRVSSGRTIIRDLPSPRAARMAWAQAETGK